MGAYLAILSPQTFEAHANSVANLSTTSFTDKTWSVKEDYDSTKTPSQRGSMIKNDSKMSKKQDDRVGNFCYRQK